MGDLARPSGPAVLLHPLKNHIARGEISRDSRPKIGQLQLCGGIVVPMRRLSRTLLDGGAGKGSKEGRIMGGEGPESGH